MKEIVLVPLGVIHTPHTSIEGMPVQPVGATDFEGQAVLDEEYAAGLKDLDGFSHIILLYRFHKIQGYELQVVPFMDVVPHGIFATRAPKRPNAIGISIVPLLSVESNIVRFGNADMLDGSPLLDIKPFFPKYDNQINVRAGWLEMRKGKVEAATLRSDGRFI
jgi:tRNA-Thr(GGU) m(6)t(6)A37 methyltransferase TsaA